MTSRAKLRSAPTIAALALALVGAAVGFLMLMRPAPIALNDDFSLGRVDPARWVVTSQGELSEEVVDVVAPDEVRGRRLRIRVGSRGTRDDEVKRLGVRTVQPVLSGSAGSVGVELDWNNQDNGSYLEAYIVLSPHRTEGDVLATPDWVRAGYVGVPPGRNARLVVSQRVSGLERTLFAEGWPEANREGRRISRQKLDMRMRGSTLEVVENGKVLFQAETPMPETQEAFLYLQVSTHSNFSAREVFFDDVIVRGG